MLKKLITMTATLLFAVSASNAQQNQQNIKEGTSVNNISVVEGEGLHYVKISTKDISRISCSSEIGEPFFSKEKEMEVYKHNKELFVKILPRQTVFADGRTSVNYSNIPREIYIECAGRFFSLVLIPDNVPAQQIVLNTPNDNIFNAMATETASDYENVIHDLIKSAYLGVIPSGFKLSNKKDVMHFEEAALTLNKTYTGYKFIIEVWSLKSKLNEEKEFDENVFVPLFKDIRAITLINPKLLPEEESKMIIIRQNTTAERK
ncbi:MAG: type-F conjugative transfer system secretin TraK [Deferribacteraceae bacterium]|jgi:hypothetical protein|nr:type-F conjugative transfer system secretin TraK [Deferribacteraceae bacterium]